jgi:urocanate hydratase
LKRQVNAINKLAERGMYFWDYGNAFLLEADRAGTYTSSHIWLLCNVVELLHLGL